MVASVPIPIGTKVNRLKVIEDLGPINGRRRVICECDCGVTKEYTWNNIRNNKAKSCGCLNIEKIIARNVSNSTHGMSKSREFNSWRAMKERCLNKDHKAFDLYGGRGITICERWVNSFENFYADMGVRPPNTTLDRINVNGNYEPNNCRWASPSVQGNNRRTCVMVEYKGVVKSISDWAIELGLERKTLEWRIRRGWDVEKAFYSPLQQERKNK